MAVTSMGNDHRKCSFLLTAALLAIDLQALCVVRWLELAGTQILDPEAGEGEIEPQGSSFLDEFRIGATVVRWYSL